MFLSSGLTFMITLIWNLISVLLKSKDVKECKINTLKVKLWHVNILLKYR